jgi:hypothetical protein
MAISDGTEGLSDYAREFKRRLDERQLTKEAL